MSDQATLTLHQEALWRAIVYIQTHLQDSITLKDIANAAHYSPYYIHRLFKRYLNESVKSYIRRLRMDQAAFTLKISQQPILDIALQSGYDTHETFTRAFLKAFDNQPSGYRKKHVVPSDTSSKYISNVELLYFAGRQCVFERYIGAYEDTLPPDQANSLWHALLSENKAIEKAELFGICHDEPEITKQPKIRYDACVTYQSGVNKKAKTGQINQGMVIHAIHKGPFNKLSGTYHHLIYEWSKLFKIKIHPYQPPFEKFNLKKTKSGLTIKSIEVFIPVLD